MGADGGRMTVQQAAYDLLMEDEKPVSSRELARRMLERHVVSSNAKDRVFSLATTIEKNIRGGMYNQPKLAFVREGGRRLIGLPGWESNGQSNSASLPGDRIPQTPQQDVVRLDVRIPAELKKKIELTRAIGFGSTDDEVVGRLLLRGLEASSSEIKELWERSKRELNL